MGDGLESVDLAAPHNAACFVPIKARQFIHDLWQIRCNYHIKGSVCKKKRKKKKKTTARFYGAPLWGRGARKGIPQDSRGRRGRTERKRREDGGGETKRERETRLVLICHRSPSPIRCPFRILDQRESYANLPRSTSRLS